jgi:hypothetical protein
MKPQVLAIGNDQLPAAGTLLLLPLKIVVYEYA